MFIPFTTGLYSLNSLLITPKLPFIWSCRLCFVGKISNITNVEKKLVKFINDFETAKRLDFTEAFPIVHKCVLIFSMFNLLTSYRHIGFKQKMIK